MKIKITIIVYVIILLLVSGFGIYAFYDSSNKQNSDKGDISLHLAKTVSQIYNDGNLAGVGTILDNMSQNAIIIISDNQGKVLLSNYEETRPNEFLPPEIYSSKSFKTKINESTYNIFSYSSNPLNMVFVGYKFDSGTLLPLAIWLLIIIVIVFVVHLSFLIKNMVFPQIYILNEFAKKIVDDKLDTKNELIVVDEFAGLARTLSEIAVKIQSVGDSQKAFLQNVSHEIKTPLMSIQSYSEAILDGIIEKEDVNDSLRLIISECHRLKNLVNELIFYGKLQSSTFMFDFKLHNLKDVLIDAIESVGGLAIKKGITFDYSPMSVFIQIDEEKMKQALMNIFSNCIRHARKNICVEVAETSNTVEIRISDDGDGFSEDDLRNLFSRFSKGKMGETGLGLSITKSIIEKHNATIEAMNGSLGGALFLISMRKK